MFASMGKGEYNQFINVRFTTNEKGKIRYAYKTIG